MKLLFLSILFVCSSVAFGQSDLPEIGNIVDIQGKSKFYLAADSENTKLILKEFKKVENLVRVDKPDDAEFIIEFLTVHRGSSNSMYSSLAYEIGEMNVYLYRDGKKIIAWRDSSKTGWKGPSVQLIRKFLKAMKAKK